MSPERRAAVHAAAERDMQAMLLAELRKHTGRTATVVAAELGVGDATLAEYEAGDDMPISTLRRLVAALGGELDLVVHLPDRNIRLNQFADVATR